MLWFTLPRSPFQEVVHAVKGSSSEAQPFVKPKRRVEHFDMNANRTAGALPLSENVLQQSTSNTAASKFREHGNIHDPDFFWAPMHIKAACGAAGDQNNLKLSAGIIALITLPLGFELHSEKTLFLAVIPTHLGQFLRSRACINGKQELSILCAFLAQRDGGCRATGWAVQTGEWLSYVRRASCPCSDFAHESGARRENSLQGNAEI